MVSAAKWGAIVGVAIYFVSQAITLIGQIAFGPTTPADPSHPGKIALGCIDLLLIAFAFSTSGFYTGRETRIAGLGAIAGMITFAVYGLLLGLLPFGSHVTPGAGGATAGQDIVLGIITIVIFLSIAALIGWLGGRPGAARGLASAHKSSESGK